ncbi:hypothetical protein BDV93DRAFT_510136 [Ceratobasidium sp. AG-I]|nr:hypothetical protein BDV93DRAFT_510136 [Ceratobasidium sp. AG-I]
MTRLSAALRRKPDWWIKFRDQDVLARWRGSSSSGENESELDGYANLRDEETSAELNTSGHSKKMRQIMNKPAIREGLEPVLANPAIPPTAQRAAIVKAGWADCRILMHEWMWYTSTMKSVLETEYISGSLQERKVRYNLAGKTIQIVVKLANIYLTPETPEYSGGSWHIEGMSNESIAISGIYYYDQENISESRLSFRVAVSEPEKYDQNDSKGCLATWGLDRNQPLSDDPCVNHLGSVITCQNRCIAFPNTYQHQVSPFELVDKTKPGHRKILALFLIDPAVHKPSTSTIPPQQQEWRKGAIAANPILRAAFNRLSPEIISWTDSLAEGTMTRKEAEDYRLELMDERTVYVDKNTEEYFSAGFSMCEH